MSRSPSRSSTRTLPPYSFAERAAGARGGTSPPSGRSAHGKPEPPPGLGRARGDPPEPMSNHKERLWHARGDPPGHADPWGGPFEHGPPGHADPWGGPYEHGPPGLGRARGDPPGRTSIPVENLRRSHGPPRQARGDPQSFAQAPPTYGFRSGPRVIRWQTGAVRPERSEHTVHFPREGVGKGIPTPDRKLGGMTSPANQNPNQGR